MNAHRRRAVAVAVAALLLPVLAGALAAVAPELAGRLAPGCPFLRLAGHPCPLCGSSRALSSLGRGDLRAAWAFNPLAVAAVPLALILAGVMATPRGAERLRGSAGRWLSGGAVLLVAAFWLWRSLST